MELGTGNRLVGGALALGVAALVSLSAPADAQAQQGVSFNIGPQGTYGTEIEAVGIGARAMLTFPQAQGIGAMGSFDWFFPDAGDYYEINANATYTVQTSGNVEPYLGAGLNIATASNGESVTNSGLNVLGGFQFDVGALSPFVEGRYATTGTGQFLITGGLLF